MSDRNDLIALIDQLPDDKLSLVLLGVEQILHPPMLDPRIEQIMRRSEEFSRELPERLKQLQAGCKPESIRGFHMGGGFGSGPGMRGGQGEHSYGWWEGITYVTHKMILHAGRELDIIDRIQLTEDEAKLI